MIVLCKQIDIEIYSSKIVTAKTHFFAIETFHLYSDIEVQAEYFKQQIRP